MTAVPAARADSPAPPSPAPGATAPETRALVTRLTVAVNRRRAYPEGHPLVRAAEAEAMQALGAVLADRLTVAFGVGREELLVDDQPQPDGGAVARELAERLRGRGVGRLTFDRSVTEASLAEALRWLADEERARSGSRPEELAVPGIHVAPIAYGRLALVDGQQPEATGSAIIWRSLAAVALLEDDDAGSDRRGTAELIVPGAPAGPGGGARGGAPGDTGAGGGSGNGDAPGGMTADDGERLDAADAGEVAQAIERRLHREGYDRRVAFVLLRVAGQVAQAPAEQRAALGERLRAVLQALRHSSLRSIIRAVGIGAEQRRFISGMIDAMPVSAIVEWLETAATATEQDLSHQLLRLVAKLNTRATEGASPGAERSFRQAARDLVTGWKLEDPNPAEHGALLDAIGVMDASHGPRALEATGAERLVQMALEADVVHDAVRAVARRLLAGGQVVSLLEWTATAPGRAAAADLEALIRSPEGIRAILLRDPLDQGAARTLLASLDAGAIEVLLDVLRDAPARTARRLVYDRLRELGPPVLAHLTPRLDGAPWFFVRNLLALLRDIGAAAGGGEAGAAPLASFLGHTHEQVRLEALRLLVADPRSRDAAIRRVLDDPSERVVRVALEALGTNEGATRGTLSGELALRLVGFVESPGRDPELVARALRALADAAPSPRVRDLLLGRCTRRTLILRRLVPVEPTPVALAALEVLAHRYAHDPRVGPVLAHATRSPDPRLRAAASPPPAARLAAS